MLDVIDQIRELDKKGRPFAVCTVIHTWRSSPRPIGSALLVTEEGEMFGSVSGGCVENAVVAKALKVLKSGQPEIANYGVADEEAWEIGLSCGGAIEVYISPFFGFTEAGKSLWPVLDQGIKTNEGVALVTALEGDLISTLNTNDSLIGGPLTKTLRTEVLSRLSSGLSGKAALEEGQFFIHVFHAKPKMILIGSAHITVEMIELAHVYGFETIVIDPRDTFAKKTGYKTPPSSLLINWPQEVLPDMNLDINTYVVILSHDPKIDDEALKIVLKSPVRYVGALGSRKTHAKRTARLLDYGFDQEEIDQIKAPIGIDISSHLPREIALSIMAEIISVKNNATED